MRIDFPVQQLNINNEIGGIDKSNVDKSSFKDFLNNAIQNVNELQLQSQKLNDALAIGATDNIPQVMIASEKAGMALQFTMQVRNKVLDAYQEIMKMQV